ncbi:MAG: hypothetical protein ACXAEN_26525, partial [Candidatus Thorarchaeota archaeon]
MSATKQGDRAEPGDFRLIALIMFAVALFAPAGMSVGYPDEFQFGLVAVTWTYAYGGFWAGFRFYDPAMWV